MTFQGTPDQQWAELMDRREKAGLERTVVTGQTGRVSFQPPVETLEEQERYEEPDFCEYCGSDPCECLGNIDYTDYTR